MSRASILLLEDDEKLRTMLQMVLEDEGYAVQTVPSGDEAIRQAAGETYDLIVTDIRMEGTDGLDALAAVKEQRPEIGSVVITNAVLTKPQCFLMAQSAHDGFARALSPAHTSYDGDAIVAAATGEVEVDNVDVVRHVAALVTADAIRAAVAST